MAKLSFHCIHDLPHTLVLLTPSDIYVPYKENGNWEKYCKAVEEGNWWHDLVVQIETIGINPVPILINQKNQVVNDSSLLIFAACLETKVTHFLCWQVDNESAKVFADFLDNFGD